MSSATHSEVRWLLVGAGDIARKRVAAALASVPGSRLVGVCDVREEQARLLAEERGAPEVFTAFDEALSRSEANAVYLATPVWLHAEQTIAAVASGRHVLVEKPLGLSYAEAGCAAEAAEGRDVRAGCAYFRRLTPRYAMVKEMLDAGQFGRVVLVRLCFFSWFAPEPTDPKYWRVVRARSGGGPLADMGTHMLDVLIGLFGLPQSVVARCDNLVHCWDVEDSAAVMMRLRGGAMAVGSFHWNSKTWSHEFEIVGTEAKIKWHPYDGPKILKTVGRESEEIDCPNAENVHLPLVEDFVRAIHERRQPVVPLSEAAKTNALLDAIYQAARSGQEVTL